ncbi:nucleotidyltransferase [Shouchella patagoniensis]|uniref:nucleotidyltransferase n=1 Tax=Shouchella patagoniensis TaxID=228576 RepID=UPI000994EDDA|nr:nucleotidyltransferase [Shouchella patagoniensis]
MLIQEEMIQKVKDKCKRDDTVVSAMMYGSFTKGEGDIYSDIEFYLFVNNAEYDVFDSLKWISTLDPVDLFFVNEYGTEVVVFNNMVRGEFHFLPEEQIEIIRSFKPTGVFPDTGSMFIYDSTNKLKPLLDYLGGAGPDRKTNENVNFAFNHYVNAWLMGINVLKRGEHARSLDVLSQVQKYTLQLMRVEGNTVERWLNGTKNLEEDLSQQSYKDYASITAKLNHKEILRAYQHSLTLIESLYLTLRHRYKVDLNERLIKKLYDYVNNS